MIPTIVHNTNNVVMVQSSRIRPSAEIIALVEGTNGGTWEIPHVWSNVINGEKVVTANPKQNQYGWAWLVCKVADVVE